MGQIDDRRVQIPPPPPPPPPPPSPPPVAPPGPQEKIHVVKPGDTLEGIAREHTTPDAEVTAQEIADRNATETTTAINPGDSLIIPTVKEHPAPATPAATPEAQRVDTALQAHLLAQDNLAAVSATPGVRNDPDWQTHRAGFQQQVNDTRTELQNAVDAQIDADFAANARPTGDILDTATIAQYGGSITQRHANDPAAQAAIEGAVQQVGIDHEVDSTLTTANAMPDAEGVVNYLSTQLGSISPEAQSRLLASPEFNTLIDRKVAPALTEPLQGEPWKDSINAQSQVRESLQALQTLVTDADPRLAQELVDRELTALDDLQTRAMNDGYGMTVGPEGTRALVHIAGEIGGTPAGDALVRRMAELPVDGLTLNQGVAEGASPDLLLAIAANGGGEMVSQLALDGVQQFRDGTLKSDAEAYIEHVEELNYLIANGGAAMTPEQFDAAINEYIANKGPEWEQELETLQNRLADDGARLLDQTAALSAGIDGLPADQQAEFRERTAALLQDPHAQLAVTTALRQQPELARGEQGQRLIETFADLGIVGGDNALATTATAAYLRENVLAPSANLDLSDPAALAQARDDLNAALRSNPALAQVLDVTPEQLDGITDSLLDLVPTTPSSVDAATAMNNAARNLNNTLDQLDRALGRDTPFNTQFRTAALGIVSAGLVNSTDNFLEDPNLRNGLQVLVDTARVGVDGAQFVAAVSNVPEGSLVNGLRTAGRVVHVLGAGLAGIDALGRLGQGDLAGAGFNAAIAGGVGYAVFGSSAWAGPIGFGVATIATLGLFAYDSWRASEHNSRFETQTTQDFLAHADLDTEAAAALRDQSGEGYSPVPMLMRYGELHGLDRAQTVDWINDLPPAALARLRDVAHVYLDEHDGDIGGFESSAAGDGEQLADIDGALDRRLPLPPGTPDPLQNEPWELHLENVTVPQSAAVLDRFMELWQLPQPGQS